MIEAIRAERLALVEILAENRLQVVDTVLYVATTSPLMLQNVAGALETYQLKQGIYQMISDLEALEEELMQRLH